MSGISLNRLQYRVFRFTEDAALQAAFDGNGNLMFNTLLNGGSTRIVLVGGTLYFTIVNGTDARFTLGEAPHLMLACTSIVSFGVAGFYFFIPDMFQGAVEAGKYLGFSVNDSTVLRAPMKIEAYYYYTNVM